MTLTNHARDIGYNASLVIEFTDKREYELAHCALDDIESKVHALRRHLDKLQDIFNHQARLEGGL